MGESTCLMQVQPFCYASGLPREINESNPMHALGQSISFGRFTSESLAWEKWSTFNHNRYVEEAERYSRPGSVAQKKAFFEAHYKKLAAQRAAALLEQANNSASNNVSKQETEGSVDSNAVLVQVSPQVSCQELEKKIATSEVSSEEQENKILYSKTEVICDSGCDSIAEANETLKRESADLVSKCAGFAGNPTEGEIQIQFKDSHDHMIVAKKNSSSFQELTPIFREKPPIVSLKNTGILSSHAIPRAPTPSREVDSTPTSKGPPVTAADKHRTTPKSLYMSVNFTPLKELNRLTASVMKKIENSRVGSSSTKISKDSLTPLRTPTLECKTAIHKQNLVTPSTEKKGTKKTMDSTASGNRKAGARWRLLSSENRARSPIISSPFNLRTEERAARRKTKLEEKFDSNEVQKVQLHTKLKEKAESEIRKLGQTFCFKARPLPEFYKERKGPKNEMKQIPLSHSQHSKQERSSPSGVKSKSSLPPQRPSIQSSGPKRVHGKNGQSHENRSPNIQRSTQRHRE